MTSERSREELINDLEASPFEIDDYLELRERFPGEDSPFWMFFATSETSFPWALEFAWQLESELEKFDISIQLFLGAMDGDEADTDALCLNCLNALSKREKIEEDAAHIVANGEAIGDALIDFLIGGILESISHNQLPIPHSFQVLLKCRLGLFNSKIKEERALHDRDRRLAGLIAAFPELSLRKVADETGLNVNTISRKMQDPDFLQTVELHRRKILGENVLSPKG